MRLYARCMRSHGVSRFPDPAVFGGDAFGFSLAGAGIDLYSRRFKQARRACDEHQRYVLLLPLA